jgi:hypothetical protein
MLEIFLRRSGNCGFSGGVVTDHAGLFDEAVVYLEIGVHGCCSL